MDSTVKRGDIFYADLSPVVGSEQGGTRPVLIVQNDTGNRHSPTVIAAAIPSLYFDWFGGCIQAFIFCTLTTLFIKQAADG